VPGLVGDTFNYALIIEVQRVEVGAIWGPELLGPKYFNVVSEPILHQMAILCAIFPSCWNTYGLLTVTFLILGINFS
jgi:hypothetical protein